MVDALFRRLGVNRFAPTDLARGPWTPAALHRFPRVEWVCLDATSRLEPHGVGIAESTPFDAKGRIGRSMQSLLVEARG